MAIASKEETRNAIESIFHDYKTLEYAFKGDCLEVFTPPATLHFYVESGYRVSVLEDFTLSGAAYPFGVYALSDFELICLGLSKLKEGAV